MREYIINEARVFRTFAFEKSRHIGHASKTIPIYNITYLKV